MWGFSASVAPLNPPPFTRRRPGQRRIHRHYGRPMIGLRRPRLTPSPWMPQPAATPPESLHIAAAPGYIPPIWSFIYSDRSLYWAGPFGLGGDDTERAFVPSSNTEPGAAPTAPGFLLRDRKPCCTDWVMKSSPNRHTGLIPWPWLGPVFILPILNKIPHSMFI